MLKKKIYRISKNLSKFNSITNVSVYVYTIFENRPVLTHILDVTTLWLLRVLYYIIIGISINCDSTGRRAHKREEKKKNNSLYILNESIVFLFIEINLKIQSFCQSFKKLIHRRRIN